MRNLFNHQQIRMLDTFDSVLTDQSRKHLLENLQGVFRHVLLELRPVGALSEQLAPVMGVTIKRFLTQLKRHNKAHYDALDESLLQRYAPAVNRLFADVSKDTNSRRQLRQQVAEDMYSLIRYFTEHPKHCGKDTYKHLVRIFCGVPAVFHAILLKMAGWNMLRTAFCAKMRKIVYERAYRVVLGHIFANLSSRITTPGVCIGRKTKITAYLQRYGELIPFHVAA